jgi:hypothetical protein
MALRDHLKKAYPAYDFWIPNLDVSRCNTELGAKQLCMQALGQADQIWVYNYGRLSDNMRFEKEAAIYFENTVIDREFPEHIQSYISELQKSEWLNE